MWTDDKNKRRCDLIDKEIDGTITDEEKVELEQLQEKMSAYRQQVAPLPLDELRKLRDELKRELTVPRGETMKAMMYDQTIINQYKFVGFYQGENQVEIMKYITTHLENDPSKPTVTWISFEPDGKKAQAHFYLPKERKEDEDVRT